MLCIIEKDNAIIVTIENPDAGELSLIKKIKDFRNRDAEYKKWIDDMYENYDKARAKRYEQLSIDSVIDVSESGLHEEDDIDLPFQ